MGIPPDSSQEEVEKAYRKAVLQWHPDKSKSPDAPEIFLLIQRVARIVRDPRLRRLYDLERDRYRSERGFRETPRRRARAEPPRSAHEHVRRERAGHEPLPPPPEWLAPVLKLHFDAVHIALDAPMRRARASAFLYGCCFTAAVGALVLGDLGLFGLALVLFAIGRVLKTPPHEGVLSWAKLAPARRLAEYHLLDQRAARYERFSIPYSNLRVAVMERHRAFQIEIAGFPRASVPVLFRTASRSEAVRLAREASTYLSVPLAA